MPISKLKESFVTPENLNLGILLARADIQSGNNPDYIRDFYDKYQMIARNELRKMSYPEDQRSREEIAKSIGCKNSDDLIALIGPDEFMDRIEK